MTARARDTTETSAEGRQPVSIVIPCRAEYVGLCRILAGVVGAHDSMHVEDIADLKLAVTEACTCFLPGSEEESPSKSRQNSDDVPESLRVDFRIQADSWEIAVSDAEERHALSEESSCLSVNSGGLGLTIMKALADRVEHTYADSGGSVLRLFKQVETEPGYLS